MSLTLNKSTQSLWQPCEIQPVNQHWDNCVPLKQGEAQTNLVQANPLGAGLASLTERGHGTQVPACYVFNTFTSRQTPVDLTRDTLKSL